MSGFTLNRILLASLLLLPIGAKAQEEKVATLVEEAVEKRAPLLRGMAVSADIVLPLTNMIGTYGGYEAALRINLKDKYFPVFELGLGTADHTDEETTIHYNTTAPYFRVGLDLNMLRNKNQDNRLYVGLRGGYTTFNYDYTSPGMTDPVWGGGISINMKDKSSNMAWFELVFGIEAEVFKDFHMGWSARYKARIHQKASPNGDPWYVPGYGINGNTRFGATYNLIFDLPLAKRKIVK